MVVCVNTKNWKSYSDGVFDNCDSKNGHCVLLVGIASRIWKVKNSWGPKWGEKGYIRLSPGNTCGIC